MTQFSAEVYQNEYLAEGAGTVDAVVTVNAEKGGPPASRSEAVEVIVIDCSGSMKEEGGAKMEGARRGTMAAIDSLRDGVWFAVVAGTSSAWPLYRNVSAWSKRMPAPGQRQSTWSPASAPRAAPPWANG